MELPFWVIYFFVFGRKSCTSKVYYYLCTTKQGRCLVFVLSRRDGSLAKWLGTGLQNRLRRFDSATNLTKRSTVTFCNGMAFVLLLFL